MLSNDVPRRFVVARSSAQMDAGMTMLRVGIVLALPVHSEAIALPNRPTSLLPHSECLTNLSLFLLRRLGDMCVGGSTCLKRVSCGTAATQI
jgi:hypothetical protein